MRAWDDVGTTSYISMKFHSDSDKFADYIVHEAAHAFHNCKRAQFAIRVTRTREFLLNVNYHHRETFAYACEVNSRILQTGKTRAERVQLAHEAVNQIYKVTIHHSDKNSDRNCDKL